MSDIPGLYEGVEAVKVLVNGTEIYLRLTAEMLRWTLDKVIGISTLIAGHIQNKMAELKEGEVSFKELLDKDKSGIGMLQIEEAKFGLLESFAKEMGLSYSRMPDINKRDIYIEVAFPERQGEAFRYFIAQHADIAKSYTYGEYFDNAIPEDIEAEIRGLESRTVRYAEQQVRQEMQGYQQPQINPFPQQTPQITQQQERTQGPVKFVNRDARGHVTSKVVDPTGTTRTLGQNIQDAPQALNAVLPVPTGRRR